MAAAAPEALPVIGVLGSALVALVLQGPACDATCMLRGAQRAAAARDWALATELYESALAQRDTGAEHWRALGDALYQQGRARDAIAALERALLLGAAEPHRVALQVARAYASLDNRTQSLRWAGHAVDFGLRDRALLRDDPGLARYRDDPRMRALVDGAGAAGGRRAEE